jgi:hypothetical protein
MSGLHSSSALQAWPHIHIVGDQCPLCEQTIPNDRLEDVDKRIQARDRQMRAEADARVNAEVQSVRAQGEAALEAAKAQFAAREETARKDGEARAVASFEKQIADSAAAVKAAAERQANLEVELAQSKEAIAQTIEKMNADFAKKAEAVRLEGRAAAVAEMDATLSEAREGKAAAEAKVAEVETQKAETEKKMSALQASHEETVKTRTAEVREAMEKANMEAVNAERAKNFEEKLKLEEMVADLQRKLQNKTTEELGEGAEVDLYEVLKAEFPNDDIQRVGRGKPGADIIHKVRHNGAVCGTIVYDSKNHKQWRSEFVTKLRQDQIAAKAEHAVLATHVFPKDRKQLHINDGVILANPARAVVIAMILRQQVLQVHCLKVSNEERASKTEELYAFITSDRFGQFLSAINTTTAQLEALQVAEKKSHENNWKKQGELFRSIIRNCAQLDEEVARIIGTAPTSAS